MAFYSREPTVYKETRLKYLYLDISYILKAKFKNINGRY